MADFDLPGRYLRENFERLDRLAVVLIHRGTDGKPDHVQQKFATAEQIASPRFQAQLRAANANGSDVYISMNTIGAEAQGRTKADIETIRHIYLDVDIGGADAVNRILSTPGMPNPHHLLETSPGKHQIIWQVEAFDKGQAEELLRGLAAAHQADPAVTDCSRVLRLPGFRNCKYGEPHYVRDVHETPAERVWTPEDFPAYRTARQNFEGPARKPHSGGDGQLSQSERDWSYAMRALERGESPSVIQARIEAYRQDKPNPHYYAERTVSRALAYRARSASHPPRESSNPLDMPGLER
jgi:hypothetical protein